MVKHNHILSGSFALRAEIVSAGLNFRVNAQAEAFQLVESHGINECRLDMELVEAEYEAERFDIILFVFYWC